MSMRFDSEINLAFAKSPIALTEEQEEMVLANQETNRRLWRIVDLLLDPGEDSRLTDLMVTAEWLNIRNILWPGMISE